MSYCVHCGVRLGESEKRCPLCGTPVIDPLGESAAPVPRAYPVRGPEQELKRSKRFFLSLFALILVSPSALCLMIDLLAGGRPSWSIYPASALFLLYIAIAVPIILPWERRPSVSLLLSFGVCFLTLSLFLFLVERRSASGQWFFPIALPAIAFFTILCALIALLYRRDRLNKLTLLAALFMAVAVECLLIEQLCSLALEGKTLLVWSPFAAGPCVFISLVLFFINGNHSVREEVRRRVHF